MKRLSSNGGSKRPSSSGASYLRPARLMVLALMLLLAAAIFAAAGQASETATEPLGAQLQKSGRQALNQAEKTGREAAKAATKEAEQQKRAANQALRAARRSAREVRNLGPKVKADTTTTISCTKVTVDYQGFNEVQGHPNYVVEWISIKNAPESITPESIEYKPLLLSFTGTEYVAVQPIAFPVGRYTIAVHAKWNTNGAKGRFEANSHVTCGPAPAFVLSTVQSIAGSAEQPTSEAISAKVGNVIDYASTVTNTGNTPVTFSAFQDPQCDAGTITGGSLAAIEPAETLTFNCSHTLTTADQEAGSYSNEASITGEPEAYEGGPIAHSNTLVVTPIGAEEAKNSGGTTTTVTVVTTTTTTAAPEGKTGVLTFKATSVPALKGPRGCVRSGFTVSIRSAGVSTVVFALDGRKLATRSYKNAHKGLISLRINPAKLKAGAHRLTAAITMKKSSSAATAARATRRLTVVRCK